MRMKIIVLVIGFLAISALILMAGYQSGQKDNTIKDLKSSNADLLRFYSMEKARSHELEKRSVDRDKIELELRACLKQQVVWVNQIEDLKWQMDVTISSCPGRSRPPNLPRP